MGGERSASDLQGARFNDDKRVGKGVAITEDLEEKFGRSALGATIMLEQGRVAG
ncbi:hypothetical protein TIFTF001_017241 [Ficus carica]|uniref:Uncharacterized protein n=1 Tax=Ficus carica TaxID=3494 RepID=A0AA88A8V6_FICCA|nr:hypothetical protein TIFTF001_017241 [Ficus carica]